MNGLNLWLSYRIQETHETINDHILESILGIDHKYSMKQELNAKDARLIWMKLRELVIITWIRLIESKLSWINLKKRYVINLSQIWNFKGFKLV